MLSVRHSMKRAAKLIWSTDTASFTGGMFRNADLNSVRQTGTPVPESGSEHRCLDRNTRSRIRF